jgi:nucleotide-binding universal stress UspA family protein
MKLLCATDLLPKSDAAVERAHLMRKQVDGRLTFLHVVQPGDAHEGTLEQRLLSAQSRLARHARRATSPVELVVRCGRPASVLREVASARRADLVIVGPHESCSVGDALRGTFIERIVGEARCPVLIVRQPPREAYRGVMLALDESTTSGHIVGVTESLVAATGGPWSLVHAHEPPYEALMTTLRAGDPNVARYSAESMAQAVALMRDMLGRHSREPRRYQVAVIEARPAAAIRRAVTDASPDLLVLGTRGLGRFRRALFGSTAHEVLNATTCDVLLVPPMALRAARFIAGGTQTAPDPGPGAA